jgi:hypothetical protein
MAEKNKKKEKKNDNFKLLNKINKLITGDDIDDFENEIFKSFDYIKDNAAPYQFDTFKELINNISKNDDDLKSNKILQDIIQESLENNNQEDLSRIQKYKDCQAIKNKIGYARRALKCIKDNILNADYFNNKTFYFVFNENDDNEVAMVDKYNKILEYNNFNLLNKIKSMLNQTLLNGDYFIEILNPKDFLSIYNKNIKNKNDNNDILLEHISYKLTNNKNENIQDLNIQMEFEGFNALYKTPNIEQNFLSEEIISKNGTDRKKEENNLNTTKIITHTADKVIKLGDGIDMGYVILGADYDLLTHKRFGLSKLNFNKDTLMKTSNNIFNKLSKKLEELIGNKSFIKNEGNEDLLNLITDFLLQYPSSLKKINIRYVPENRMVHFKNIGDNAEDKKYGESIFESQIFNGKLLIALKTALTISRITNSIEKDIMYIELGLNRDARTVIESFKENYKKKKISIDKMGNVDSIPSMIPNYEAIYIPQKDGRRFVEMDKKPTSSTSYQTDDIRMIRDEFVAGLDVPPQLIGLEENASMWQNTLSEQNLYFARTIINYQNMFANQIKELLDKIFMIANMADKETEVNYFDKIEIKFYEPKQLKMRLQSDYISNVLNMVDQLSQYIDVDRKILTNKFLKNVLDNNDAEWMDLINSIEKINKNKDDQNNTNNMGF